jgi:Fe-S cluster assembly protein SufB
MVPDDIKKTFDRIGIPEAERKFLGGASAQYDSEVVYHNLKKEWEDQGVVFLDMDSGLREYPEIVKQHFGTIIPTTDNKFAALNTAVWSGGSFVYIPAGVKVKIPLQAYFRINTKNAGQFERTLIIAEEGASVHYIEGCSAPIYSAGALHSAVVEVLAKKNSYVRYTTIQNWSNNVYNLVTKRAVAHENSVVEWLDGNIGSKITMKYPCIILKGKGARGEVLSVAFAGKGQSQDAGAKIIHQAPNTTSRIISKSISQGGGRSSYRGLLKVVKGAKHCKAFVQCDAYLLDSISRSDTYPAIQIDEDTTTIGHEAKVGKIADDKLFYLMSRGISEKDALAMIVLGFIESFTRELPMEYAVELNRLIEMQLEGAVG